MLLPIGDEPNAPRHVAWMNYTIIGANVLVFLLVQMSGGGRESVQEILWNYGYVPAESDWTRLFTCLFMHDGFWHIAGNMLFLWIFGDNMEARLGPFGYLAAYLALGVVATLVFAGFNADSTIPLVGASGAISGVQGLYFIACPRHKVKLFVWFYFFISVVRVNARLIMGLWFVMQDLIPTVIQIKEHTGGGGVAHMAHLGGFVGGVVLMLVLRPLVGRIEQMHAAEFGGVYSGGSAKSKHYQRTRRRNPYERSTGPRPPPLPQRPTLDDRRDDRPGDGRF